MDLTFSELFDWYNGLSDEAKVGYWLVALALVGGVGTFAKEIIKHGFKFIVSMTDTILKNVTIMVRGYPGEKRNNSSTVSTPKEKNWKELMTK